MKQRIQRKVSVLAMVVVGLLSACGAKIQETKIENPSAQHRLLIAVIEGQSSAFKEAVIQQLLENYKNTSAIEVLNVSKIEQISQKPYDVVVLIDQCKGGMRFNATFKELAAKVDQQKLVAFITSGDDAWKYSENGVDAVTSASKNDNVPEVAQEIAKKIDESLNK